MSTHVPPKTSDLTASDEIPPRRSFFVRATAALLGFFAMVVPVASGAWFFVDPLRRKSSNSGKAVFVAPLNAIPDNGLPQAFRIKQDVVDAWNFYPNEPVGMVYVVRKKGEKTLTILHSECPHAGCAVNFIPESNCFLCPCHNSSFDISGERIQPCASPRRLDELSVEVKGPSGQEQVWVVYENFKTGIAEKKVQS